MTVPVVRRELSAGDLRREAARCQDAAAARRMLALALVLEGRPRHEAAEYAGMDRQTLRDWVHRYNAEGLAGLRSRARPGAKSRLAPEQLAQLRALIEQGRKPGRSTGRRWTRCELQRVIEERFSVSLHERSVGKLLTRMGLTDGRAPVAPRRQRPVRRRSPSATGDPQDSGQADARRWLPEEGLAAGA